MNLNLALAMEEKDKTKPVEINSFDVNKVLQAHITYLNKKRKYQAEQTGLPLLKHKCWDCNLNSDSSIPSDEIPLKNSFEIQAPKEKTVNETTTDNMDIAKTVSDVSVLTSDTSASLSVNCSNGSFNSDPYCLESGLISPNSEEFSYPRNNFGQDTCINYDESVLEFGSLVDCYGCIEHESSGIELCQDKEDEEMVYSNKKLHNYVLSPGNLNIDQGDQNGSKKPTIDKEFEEYFSMLML